MSEIRALIANAQEAENRGNAPEAVRLLREAAAWYRDRQMLKRAAQMLRQARRVEGIGEPTGDEVFGFGAHFEGERSPPETEELPEVAQSTSVRQLVEQRGPQLADPALDAWCSFCCRPMVEVGPLVAGPAGAYLCADCVLKSRALLGLTSDLGAAPMPPRVLAHALPAQRKASARHAASPSILALVLGPAGTGKSTWVRTLSQVQVLDGAIDEAELLHRLESRRGGATVLVVTGPVPQAAVVLQGPQGEEPLYDSAALQLATGLCQQVVQHVDLVHTFPPADEGALLALAKVVALDQGKVLSDAVLTQLVAVAGRSDRGAHELMALLARVPRGTYQP
jgi:ClpX C4-type zinc finger